MNQLRRFGKIFGTGYPMTKLFRNRIGRSDSEVKMVGKVSQDVNTYKNVNNWMSKNKLQRFARNSCDIQLA